MLFRFSRQEVTLKYMSDRLHSGAKYNRFFATPCRYRARPVIVITQRRENKPAAAAAATDEVLNHRHRRYLDVPNESLDGGKANP